MPDSHHPFLLLLSLRLGFVFFTLLSAQTAQAQGTVTGVTLSAGSKNPPALAKIYLFPSQTLACTWENAAGLEHKCNQTRYAWSCSGGQFLVGQSRNGLPRYARTALGKRATWTAPAHSQEVTLICTLRSVPAAVLASRSCTVTVLSATLTVRRVGALKRDPDDPNHVKTLPADFTGLAGKAACLPASCSPQRLFLCISGRLPRLLQCVQVIERKIVCMALLEPEPIGY